MCELKAIEHGGGDDAAGQDELETLFHAQRQGDCLRLGDERKNPGGGVRRIWDIDVIELGCGRNRTGERRFVCDKPDGEKPFRGYSSMTTSRNVLLFPPILKALTRSLIPLYTERTKGIDRRKFSNQANSSRPTRLRVSRPTAKISTSIVRNPSPGIWRPTQLVKRGENMPSTAFNSAWKNQYVRPRGTMTAIPLRNVVLTWPKKVLCMPFMCVTLKSFYGPVSCAPGRRSAS